MLFCSVSVGFVQTSIRAKTPAACAPNLLGWQNGTILLCYRLTPYLPLAGRPHPWPPGVPPHPPSLSPNQTPAPPPAFVRGAGRAVFYRKPPCARSVYASAKTDAPVFVFCFFSVMLHASRSLWLQARPCAAIFTTGPIATKHTERDRKHAAQQPFCKNAPQQPAQSVAAAHLRIPSPEYRAAALTFCGHCGTVKYSKTPQTPGRPTRRPPGIRYRQ